MTTTAPIRPGCYVSCYYAQSAACECGCGGENHQAAFHRPDTSAAIAVGEQQVIPTAVAGDSRPASTPPPPPPGRATPSVPSTPDERATVQEGIELAHERIRDQVKAEPGATPERVAEICDEQADRCLLDAMHATNARDAEVAYAAAIACREIGSQWRERIAPTPSDRAPRPVGAVRADCAHIQSGADADAVLHARGVPAEFGTRLDAHPEFLQGAASAVLDAYDRYPQLREGPNRLQRITVASALPEIDNSGIRRHFRRQPHAQAVCGHGTVERRDGGGERTVHFIAINDLTDDRVKALTRASTAAPGDFAPATDTAYGIVMHEMGHAVTNAHFGRRAPRVITAHATAAGFSARSARVAVSRYAATKAGEFFAEAFAQYNAPEGWSVYDADTRARLGRFADLINNAAAAGRRVL